MTDNSASNNPPGGGGNNDKDNDDGKKDNPGNDSYATRKQGTFAGFLKQKPRGYFKRLGVLIQPDRITHHQQDREHLLDYKGWSAN